MRRVAGECFEVEFRKENIFKKICEERCKYIYTHGTRQDKDKGRLTAMPSWEM